MSSPMMKVFQERDRREKRIALFWTLFSGFILVVVFVALGLAAIEQMPDPKVPVTLSVTPIK